MSSDLDSRFPFGDTSVDPEVSFQAIIQLAGTDFATVGGVDELFDLLGVDRWWFRKEFRRWRFLRRARAQTNPTMAYRNQLRDEIRQREEARQSKQDPDACPTCGVSGDPAISPCRLPGGNRSKYVHSARAKKWGLDVRRH